MKCLIQSRKQRSNAHRYQQRNKTRPTPCTHQLTLPGFGTKIGTIDIHCKNGGNTVHHRCQRTDNRCRKSSKCNPFYSHRQQVAQQPRISLIRFFSKGASKANAAMPGITTSNGINNLMKPANNIPFCASLTDLAANAR